MIKVYLAGVSTQFEGEDIEVHYCIYDDEELLCKKSVMVEYKKPAVVGQIALMTLLRKLKGYEDREIHIIVNDSTLHEIIRGTTTTTNKDVLNMAKKTREELIKFKNCVIQDVSGKYIELKKWHEILQH